MSTADGWDLTVPEDEAELLAELRRHGVVPGKRIRLIEAPEQVSDKTDETSQRPRRSFDFAASFTAEPDLSARTDEYLQRDFGRE